MTRHVLHLAFAGACTLGLAQTGVRAGHDQDRRAQQLQVATRLPRALQERVGDGDRGDQRQGRRARPEARGGLARRRRRPGHGGARRRRARRARGRQHPRRHLLLAYRAGHHQFRRPEEGLLPRRRAADRQDHLAGGQPLHLPPATLDLHAGQYAGPACRGGKQEALGAGLSELRIRAIRRRQLQGIAQEGAARCRVRHRAGPAARQARCRRRGAGDRRRQARRHFQRDVRHRSREVRARRQYARHVQEPHRGEPALRRAGIPRPAQGRVAGRLDRHRLSLGQDQHARAQGVRRRLPEEIQRLSAARLGRRLRHDEVAGGRHRQGRLDRHREADRGVPRPARSRARSARSSIAPATTRRRSAPSSARSRSKRARAPWSTSSMSTAPPCCRPMPR